MASSAEFITFEELEEVIHLVNKVHGYNFFEYSRASLKRRVSRVMGLNKINLFELNNRLINDEEFFEYFLKEITVNVTEMFRDPEFFKGLREKVLPYLASFQHIKIWNAGCSTGEEVYSYAVLLKEQELYNRSLLYGTDINADVLEHARKGIYDLKKMKLYSENYRDTGTAHSLSDSYTALYDAAAINHNLKTKTLFSIHNLVSDGVFNEFQLISCRNVLIYFTVSLQEKVIRLFYDSLQPLGFLCLGSKECLRDEAISKHFKVIDKKFNIYQKIG
ncbi:protein-glutamate O-methyltransferase CheR [Daejeonella sp.]|uniref:CheR family methyltransferase n=1 Tax=Daejeonella sp. TaxID=2805397 RepID=UPI00272FAC2C|nr:protein-glutamate O-methyltransferase CheR [Daejeonella sp.]MDP2415304.1 protein-glutamate O-methyltransferase CheR [Daejeonella sp.]